MADPKAIIDPEALKREGESSLARQMLVIYRTFNALAQQKYAQAGHAGLTTAHTSLIAQIDLSGTRIVTLAERMGITKQFAGRLVEELRALGYVTTENDPTDRRATLVKATDAGWHFLADACSARAEIEQYFQTAIGPELMAAFMLGIERLASLGKDLHDTQGIF